MFAHAWKAIGAAFALTLLTAAPAAAQLTTGTLTGTIKDAQGGVMQYVLAAVGDMLAAYALSGAK